MHGHVESIASGITDRERSDQETALANVNPSFSWVRLAQRIPVRIAIDEIPPGSNDRRTDGDGGSKTSARRTDGQAELSVVKVILRAIGICLPFLAGCTVGPDHHLPGQALADAFRDRGFRFPWLRDEFRRAGCRLVAPI